MSATSFSMEGFLAERERLHQLVMEHAGTATKRFHSLDSQVYRPGALGGPAKQLLGLVASLVLRCDDCIRYHLYHCHQEGVSHEELEEAVAIALVVGGSITIPHIRRLWDAYEQLAPRTAEE
jgi:AhpD family alkylhydroperoxidase